MLQFMGDNKKLLNLHEQKFDELGATATNFQNFQNTTNASLKNLETQVGQLALTLQSQMKDAFPSDTKKNPKDCMAVQLRCNTPKYTLVVFDMFRVFCKHNLNGS